MSRNERTPLTPMQATTRRTRSSRSAGSSVSGLTTPNSRASNSVHAATATPVPELGSAIAPHQQRAFPADPLQQEEAIEQRVYREVPGGGSEDEWEEVDDEEDEIEKLAHELEERAALDDNDDFIPSRHIQLPVMYSAPLNCKQHNRERE